jgi:hypothetical protein
MSAQEPLKMKDSYGNDTYNVGYVRLLSSYKFIPAGMIGEIFVGQRASKNKTMYTYVGFYKHIIDIVRIDDDDDDDDEVSDDKKYYYCALNYLDYEWSSKRELENFESDEMDINMPSVYLTGNKREKLGQGKLVVKYNTICVKLNNGEYYKLDTPRFYVNLWPPVQETAPKIITYGY